MTKEEIFDIIENQADLYTYIVTKAENREPEYQIKQGYIEGAKAVWKLMNE